jgi:hypothetical protein
MKSYTTQRNTYGVDTKNTSTANLTQGDEWMNDFHRRLLAKSDWPFLHRPRTLTTYAPDATFTAVAATDVCTASDTILTITGTEVVFTTTDTLPAGLSTSTTYYLIYQSATTFKVASSLANALAGTAIDITDTGTGTHTVDVTTEFWPLPYDIDLVESITVNVDGTIYTPDPVPSRKCWDDLHAGSSDYDSDSAEKWFVEDGKFAIWPRSATSGNTITLNVKIRVPDLNIADYTTGTIASVTNGSVQINGTGTSWTAPMAGRWLRITHSNTAASSGDGEWYRINSVESGTVLYIDRPYGGRTLAATAGASYTIGMMPLLPEAFHDLPEIYASYRYWAKEKDERTSIFKDMLSDGLSTLQQSYGVNDLSMVVDDGGEDPLINPNLTISL